MRSAFALLALAGLSQAKVFLFNAEKCNTNFDNEANWMNVSVPPKKSIILELNAFNYKMHLCNCRNLHIDKCSRLQVPSTAVACARALACHT